MLITTSFYDFEALYHYFQTRHELSPGEAAYRRSITTPYGPADYFALIASLHAGYTRHSRFDAAAAGRSYVISRHGALLLAVNTGAYRIRIYIDCHAMTYR